MTEEETGTAAGVTTVDTDQADQPAKMNLGVQIESRGACERHVTVTVPREDIDKYYKKAYDELVKNSQVPGFRQGRAPRKLIESRFKKDVTDQIKGELLVDSLSQVSEDKRLAAIGEPDFDVEAIDIPDTGSLTFSFSIEVRPEFELPKWKGLEIERPAREISDADVDTRLAEVLAERSEWKTEEVGAEAGDQIVAHVTVKDGETVLNTEDHVALVVRPTLRFADGDVPGFDALMQGVKAGESRTGTMKLSDEVPNEAMRGKEIAVVFAVTAVQRRPKTELTPEVLASLGDFEDAPALRDAIKKNLERQVKYQGHQRARQQILGALTASVNLDLPRDLLQRQAQRELERAILELRSSGFSDQQIQAYGAQLKQSSLSGTAKALKEHFVLERISEEESIDANETDYEMEVQLLAMQTNQSVRRVRAQLEKNNQMDALRNQIVERKVLDLVLQNATIKEVPYEFESVKVTACDWPAIGTHFEPQVKEVAAEAVEAK